MIPRKGHSNLHPHAPQPEFGDWRTDLPRPEEAEHYPPHSLPTHAHRNKHKIQSGKLSLGARLLRLCLALLLLLPLNALIIYALIYCLGHFTQGTENVHFWLRTPIWYSILGALVFFAFALMGLARRQLLYLYVLGHELTHAVSILLCGGKIKGLHVSVARGGYVLTNKTNLFISLSPYFIPFWMLVWMLLVWLMNALSPFATYPAFFYAGFGFWLAYHFYWTAYSILQERQPDLFDNGLLFSLFIIILLNFIILISTLILFGLISTESYLLSFRISLQHLCGLIEPQLYQ